MNLNQASLKDKALWEKAGITLPQFDRGEMIRKTTEAPVWIHFGAGNIFRGFPAALQQNLLNKGLCDKGIVVAEGFDCEIIDKAYKPFDNLSLLVVLKADGSIDKEVIASVAQSLRAGTDDQDDWNTLVSYFRNPSLQMVSFTITEKGYGLTNSAGQYLPFVEQDFARKTEIPQGMMGKLTLLCYERYKAGALPIALVSMDNCSHNGEKLQTSVMATAEKWLENGFVDDGFLAYLKDESKVSFPWSMIDKITPRPDPNVQEMLKECGFDDTDIIITSRNTYTAAFVNAEEAQYLVVEDKFPNGRPPLEESGLIFTDRDTVNMTEKMKVCTCLNPLHTTLAIYGCLLGHKRIFEEMRDDVLKRMIERIGYDEGLPVVVDPKIIRPIDFIREVLEVRLPNPFMPDTPQRIACDTSQKLSIRFGETIKAYQRDPNLDVHSLKLIPLVFAGWCRYLMGIGDDGEPFEISPDPLLGELQPHFATVKLGDKGPFHDLLQPILSNANLFGVDLYEAGLGELTESYFAELVAGKGAVRATLEKYVLG